METKQPQNHEGHPEGFVFTNNENLKQFYLQLALMLCPSVTPESTENETLRILYTRIKKIRRMLALLDNYPWTDTAPLLTKACGFVLIEPNSMSQKDKRKLNDYLYKRINFITKMAESHDLVLHNRIFFDRIKNNLEQMLNIEPTEQDNVEEPDKSVNALPEATNPQRASEGEVAFQFPHQNNQPPAEAEINMQRIYTNDISSVKYYLHKASHLNTGRIMHALPFHQLKTLLLKIKRAVPFLQFMYTNLLTEDIQLIQQMNHKYMLDNTIPDKDRARTAEATERLTELSQQILLNRPFIAYILGQYKYHQRTLARMLHVNIASQEEEMEESETN